MSTAPARRRRAIWTTWLVILTIVFSWEPVYPDQMLLQHVPTAIGLIVLWIAAWRPGLADTSFVCVLAYLALHVIGARWIYSLVPYDEWSLALLGRELSEVFGWERNHYDRLVHLAFGVLWVVPIRDVLRRTGSARGAWLLSVTVVIAASAVYELAEWGFAMTVAPEAAEKYLGQQGDPWDAQKDMALATLGAVATAATCVLSRFAMRGRGTTPPGA